MKPPFVPHEKLEEIIARYDTPFYLYDENGIRSNARRVNAAFGWNKGFKEYFAVKATPNPAILNILKEEGCGADCSSMTELMLAEAVGFSGWEMGYNYNGKLRSAELLLRSDGEVELIRRAETPADYFATLDGTSYWDSDSCNLRRRVQ